MSIAAKVDQPRGAFLISAPISSGPNLDLDSDVTSSSPCHTTSARATLRAPSGRSTMRATGNRM
jgi:hypothetical protein